MILREKFNQIDCDTDEGKLLLAAISILTSIQTEDIKRRRWGGTISPDQAFNQISDLANRIFYEKEYTLEVKRKRKEKKRNRLISRILEK
jgi:hypothetical protein